VTALVLICSGLLAAGVAFLLNWLALIPWRRSKGKHWSERARVYYPVRVAAAGNLWTIPAALTLAAALIWPQRSAAWMLLALVTSFAVVVGTIPMDLEVFPRISAGELLRQAVANWFIRILQWFVFLCAITFNSDHFDFQAIGIFILVFLLCIFWNSSGWLFVGRKVGLFLFMQRHC